MHYPDPRKEYEEGLKRVGEAITMARNGSYREGFLRMILEALEVMEQMSYAMGMYSRDGEMLKKLSHEFKQELNKKPEHSGVSPLAGLVVEAEHVDINIDDVESHNSGNPGRRR